MQSNFESEENKMQELKITEVEARGVRVLTSKQIADLYGSTAERIKQNFQANRERYIIGKHYISLTGEELREFKHRGGNSALVSNKANILYLWTEKGALLHAKSLNTDKAWEVYDYLVDFYFRAKEKMLPEEKKEVVPIKQTVEPAKEKIVIPYMNEPIFVFECLLQFAEEQGILVKIKDIKGYYSRLQGKCIALAKSLTFNQVVYELAYELAHYSIHYKEGDMINSPLSKDYNEQAEKVAYMLLRMLDIKKFESY